MYWRKYRKLQNFSHFNWNCCAVTISYKIKFVDSVRFIASLLSVLVDNPAEGINETICRLWFFLEHENEKENSIKYKCTSHKKDYSNKMDKELKKRFKNTFEFSNKDINKFILLLRKDGNLYEYMDE